MFFGDATQRKVWEIRNSHPSCIRPGDRVAIAASGTNEEQPDHRVSSKMSKVFKVLGTAVFTGSEALHSDEIFDSYRDHHQVALPQLKHIQRTWTNKTPIAWKFVPGSFHTLDKPVMFFPKGGSGVLWCKLRPTDIPSVDGNGSYHDLIHSLRGCTSSSTPTGPLSVSHAHAPRSTPEVCDEAQQQPADESGDRPGPAPPAIPEPRQPFPEMSVKSYNDDDGNDEECGEAQPQSSPSSPSGEFDPSAPSASAADNTADSDSDSATTASSDGEEKRALAAKRRRPEAEEVEQEEHSPRVVDVNMGPGPLQPQSEPDTYDEGDDRADSDCDDAAPLPLLVLPGQTSMLSFLRPRAGKCFSPIPELPEISDATPSTEPDCLDASTKFFESLEDALEELLTKTDLMPEDVDGPVRQPAPEVAAGIEQARTHIFRDTITRKTLIAGLLLPWLPDPLTPGPLESLIGRCACCFCLVNANLGFASQVRTSAPTASETLDADSAGMASSASSPSPPESTADLAMAHAEEPPPQLQLPVPPPPTPFDSPPGYDYAAQRQSTGLMHSTINGKVRSMRDCFQWPVYCVNKMCDDRRADFMPTESTRCEALELMYKVSTVQKGTEGIIFENERAITFLVRANNMLSETGGAMSEHLATFVQRVCKRKK